MFVCVCVCVGGGVWVWGCVGGWVWVCVCERERERERMSNFDKIICVGFKKSFSKVFLCDDDDDVNASLKN